MKTEQQLPLVSFEQAKRLKELGFDWECEQFYNGEKLTDYKTAGFDEECPLKNNYNDSGFDWNDGVEKEWFSAPTVALALKWFKKIKNIVCDVVYSECEERVGIFYCYRIYEIDKISRLYSNYELAESVLLDELLTLIETNKI